MLLELRASPCEPPVLEKVLPLEEDSRGLPALINPKPGTENRVWRGRLHLLTSAAADYKR